VRAGHDVGRLVRGQGLVDLVVTEWQAEHGAEVADTLAQIAGPVQEAARASVRYRR
jgi:hypothetical protein